MSDAPMISVVMPSFNQGRYLAAAIESVLTQSYPHKELIVMDGGSTDESREILASYGSRLAYWVSEPDAGQADAIARGMRRAQGQVVAWLNSDDLYVPGAFAVVASAFREAGEPGMVYGDYYVLREPDGQRELKKKISFEYRRALYAYMPIPQPSCFMSRAAYEAVGGVDPSYSYAMDFDLFLRIGERFPVRHVRLPLSEFRVHAESKSVAMRQRFKAENQRAREARLGRAWTRADDMLVRYHLVRTLVRFLVERRVLVTRRDRSKA